MDRSSRVLIVGQEPMLVEAFERVSAERGVASTVSSIRQGVDLTDPGRVEGLFREVRPDLVVYTGGMTGGIRANQTRPADLMVQNLLAQTHVIRASLRAAPRSFLYLASSCCYPRDCPQPMRPEHLFTGPLEPTNSAYATAKLAGIEMCRAFRRQYGLSVVIGIPSNPYGPGDHLDAEDAHVIPALLLKMHRAKLAGDPRVTVWGTGRPQRDFIYADDLARAGWMAMERWHDESPINLGGNDSISIGELAGLVRRVTGYEGALVFDPSKPDGMPMKRLDATPLADMGWKPQMPLLEGLRKTYADWLVRMESRVHSG